MVGIFAMADADDQYCDDLVVDFVKDTILADSDAIRVVISLELLVTPRPWVICESANRLVNTLDQGRGQSLKIFFSRVGKSQDEGFHLSLPSFLSRFSTSSSDRVGSFRRSSRVMKS